MKTNLFLSAYDQHYQNCIAKPQIIGKIAAQNQPLIAEKPYPLEKESPVRTGKLSDYAQFIKLRLSLLVVFSAAIGFLIGSGNTTDWMKFTFLVIGGFLVTGSSNGFNQIIERDLDKLMDRTRNRPLPQNRMELGEAYVLSFTMGITGIAMLWFFMNPLSGILGLLALVLYTAIYTPLKRKTPFAVFAGAFPGAIPPLLGWVASTADFGYIGFQAWILFAVQFIWQFPHFWAIAWVMDEDYRKAGFRMLPSYGGRDKSSAFQILVYTLFLLPMSLTPVFFRMSGSISAIIITLCGAIFIGQAIKLYRDGTVKSAQQLMFGSFVYLPVVQLAVLIGK